MAQIIIKLTDTESGRVNIDVIPPMPKLVQIAKEGTPTAAEAYALAALSKIIQDSVKNTYEEQKDKHPLIMPGEPRFKLQ